ncbi:hypothetical protein HPB52_018563 [Rhipicephalus sanguineus]|uniref:WD repeat-containing protein WRAP73 n=1 Tax=Rhipicephalus sanguineus TaxID=34632 RepID=A0A9D4PX97_RHISA|nr:hypothetical protein HPB52_018563 [Rhipicephalus sanguineus]
MLLTPSSQSGEHLAVVERRDAKDFVSIINCKTWTLERNFTVASEDIADLLWAPNADTFCIWESARTGFQLYVYNAAGVQLASFGLNEEIIGIKSLSWSHCGQVVLLESFDDKLMLLETVAWGKLFDYVLPEVLTDNSMANEVVPIRPVSPGYLISVSDSVDMLSQQTAAKLSASQNYLARISATFPNVVFILDIRKLVLTAVLVHLTPVTCIAWDYQSDKLAICTNAKHLCMWTPSNALTLEVPCKGEDFTLQGKQ